VPTKENEIMADTMSTAKDKVQNFGNSVGQAATNAANNAADNVKNAAGYVQDRAKDAACQVSKSAEDAASYFGQRAEDATTAVGGRLKAAGDALRHNVPQDGTLGQASSAVAKTLEDTGSYLEREGLQGISHDMTNLIKRNPIPALLIGVGLGFLVARATTSRT
jgi:hypothetical protein